MSLDTKSSIWADSGVPVKNRAELVPPLKVYLQLGSKLSVTAGELHEDGTARNEEDGKSKQHPSFLCYSTCDATACVAACTFVMWLRIVGYARLHISHCISRWTLLRMNRRQMASLGPAPTQDPGLWVTDFLSVSVGEMDNTIHIIYEILLNWVKKRFHWWWASVPVLVILSPHCSS